MFKRLKLLQSEFEINPEQYVKTFLGYDAEIEKIEKLSISFDGYVIVDVHYKILDFSPTKLYYVNVADLKTLQPNSDQFIATIDDIPIRVVLPPNYSNAVLPIRIKKTIMQGRTNNVNIRYYGMYDTPLHTYCTILPFPEKRYIVKKKIPKELVSNTKVIYSEAEITESAKDTYETMYVTNLHITTVHTITDIKEIVYHSSKVYIVDINLIKPNMTGIIFVSQKRKPYTVMFVPNELYTIDKDTLNSLRAFLYYEEQQYTEYIKNLKL